MTKQVSFTPASEPSAGSQDSARKARDDSDSLYKVILVPFDFSEHSNRTLEYATRIAARENAKIWLLHVFRIPDYAVTQYGRRPHDCDELRWQAESAEQEAQENLSAVEAVAGRKLASFHGADGAGALQGIGRQWPMRSWQR
jgi:nucleotide-binding universal stress UspA family protein